MPRNLIYTNCKGQWRENLILKWRFITLKDQVGNKMFSIIDKMCIMSFLYINVTPPIGRLQTWSHIINIFIFSAYNYKKHRKSSIQEDLNKLYDNRPTASSSGDERSSQSFRNFHENKYGKGKNSIGKIKSYSQKCCPKSKQLISHNMLLHFQKMTTQG